MMHVQSETLWSEARGGDISQAAGRALNLRRVILFDMEESGPRGCLNEGMAQHLDQEMCI